MSLWALAKLGFHPGRMLADFGARVEEIKDEFVPQACSNTLWALAVLQVCKAGSPTRRPISLTRHLSALT